MKKFLIILLYTLAMANVCASGQKLNIGGQPIDIEAIGRGFREMGEDANRAYRNQFSVIDSDIKRYETAQVQLAEEYSAKLKRGFDEKEIKPAFDIRMKQLDRSIETCRRDLEKLNKQSEMTTKVITDMFSGAAQLGMKVIEAEHNRKTQIVVAAASAAAGAEAGQKVKNDGDMKRLMVLTSPEVMTRMGITVAASGAGLIGTYYLAKFANKYAQRYIGMPTLVSESSDKGLWGAMTSLFFSNPPAISFSDIVLPASIKASVERIAASTKIIAQHNKTASAANKIPHRNVLLFGPPGTGKTMIARTIACQSGGNVEYALVSGSALRQFKPGEDIQQLKDLFAYVKNSNKDFIIFFDEVDGFLRKRELLDGRGLDLFLEFLNLTGTKNNIKLFIATNRPNDLDEAVLSRMSESIHIGLPELEARITLILKYLNKYYGPGNTTGTSIATNINPAGLQNLALRLEGFSGREIEDIVGLVQSQLVVSQQKIITLDILNAAADEKIQQKEAIRQFEKSVPMRAQPLVAAPA